MPKPVSKLNLPQQEPEPPKETPYEGIRGPWEMRETRLASGKKYTCPCYGGLAILFDVFDDAKEKYALDCPASHLKIVVLGNFKGIMQIGEILWQIAPSAFRKEEKEEILAALPSWVEPWVKRCKEADKFVEIEA